VSGRDFLTLEIAAGAGIALAFITLYALRSNWRSTPAGRHMMTFMLVIATLMLMWVVHRGVHPLPLPAWITGMAVLDCALAWRVALLWQAQRTRVDR
jgi:hypothetical protein